MGRIYTRASLALFALGMFAAAVWAALSVQGAVALTDCETATADITADESALVDLVNAARQSQSPPAELLTISPNLSRASAWYSEDTQFGQVGPPHSDSLGRYPSERAMDCGYAGQAGENWALGFGSSSAVFEAWMNSPGHRANILAPYYRTIGVGRFGTAWTLDFGIVLDSNAQSPPSTNTPQPTNTPDATATPTATPQATSTPVPPGTQGQPSAPVLNSAPSQPTAIPTATRTPVPVPTSPPASGRQMSAGLNLVTYGGPALPIESALGSLGSNVSWVYTWDGDHWLRYFPGQPPYVNSLKTLQPGVPYFIEMKGSAPWAY